MTPLRRALFPAVAIVTGVLGFALATLRQPTNATDRPSAQFVISAEPSLASYVSSRHSDVAISSDGRRVAYLAGADQRIYVRALDSLSGTELVGTEGANGPVFSPDGKWIAYYSGGRVLKIAILGGPVVPLGEIRGVTGMSWEIGDTLVCGTYDALVALPASGGTPVFLTRRDTTTGKPRFSHAFPAVIQGGRAVLFSTSDAGLTFRMGLLDRTTGEERMLDQPGSNPRWSPSGHIIYAVERTLWALPFDPVKLRATGEAMPVLDGVETKTSGAANFAIARDDGALVYTTSAGGATDHVLSWIDTAGRVTPVEGIASRAVLDPRFSPDGRTLLYSDGDHLFSYDIRRATSAQFTRDSARNYAPLFTPDGQHIVFTSYRSGNPGLYVRRADGSGHDAPLDKPAPLVDQRAMAVARDGSQLLVSYVPTTLATWMSVRDLKDGRLTGARDFVRNTESNDYPSLSPDGRWVAFRADKVVLTERFPEGGQRQQLSGENGMGPVWSRDGRTVYYRTGDSVMAVSVRSGDALLIDRPRMLFRAPFARIIAGARLMDVGPDGRFAAVLTRSTVNSTGTSGTSGEFSGRVVFVQDWTSTLRRRLARP